jgi:lysophospholipase L1-like esterase
VLLNAGTNDLWQDDEPAAAPDRLGDLIDAILTSSPTVRVIVAKITVPPASKPAGWKTYSPRIATLAARGAAYDAAIPGVVASRGPRASLVDLSRVSTLNTVDGVHLTRTGYRQVAYLWYQAIRRVLGGTDWPTVPDPFPVPKPSISASTRTVHAGRPVD